MLFMGGGMSDLSNFGGAITGGNLCSGGHTIQWAGSANYKIPEGYPCCCGRTVVKYEICPVCGHEKMIMKEKVLPPTA
jgi:hypothetical protein